MNNNNENKNKMQAHKEGFGQGGKTDVNHPQKKQGPGEPNERKDYGREGGRPTDRTQK